MRGRMRVYCWDAETRRDPGADLWSFHELDGGLALLVCRGYREMRRAGITARRARVIVNNLILASLWRAEYHRNSRATVAAGISRGGS